MLSKHELFFSLGSEKRMVRKGCTQEVASELGVKEGVSPGGRKSFQAKGILLLLLLLI